MTTYGYCRISTKKQDLGHQIKALKKAGATHIFSDQVSRKITNKVNLLQLINHVAQQGDTIIFTDLDRVGSSIKDVLFIFETLDDKKILFQIISAPFITNINNPFQKLMIQLLISFAEFENNIIKKRIISGLEYARSNGKVFGRPKGLSEKANMLADAIIHDYQHNVSIRTIKDKYQISNSMIYNILKHKKIPYNE